MNVFDELAARYQALADSTRLQLLILVGSGSPTASELIAAVEMSQPRVARHLKVLVEAGLLQARRDGRRVRYTASGDGTAGLLVASLRAAVKEPVTKIAVPRVMPRTSPAKLPEMEPEEENRPEIEDFLL